MPIRVKLPDGNIGEFPDGMEMSAIEGVLQKQFAQPSVSQATPSPLQARADQINADISARLKAGRISPDAARNVSRYMTPDAVGRAENLAQGATFGFGDEMAGGLSGLSSKLKGGDYMPAYEQGRDQSRQAQQAYAAENPWSAGAMQAMGGVLTSPAFAGIGAPNTLANAAGQGAMVGGATGAAYGFGAGEGGIENRLGSAGVAGTIGAVTGAATPYVYEGARRAGNAVRGRWEGNPVTAMALRAEPVTPETADLYHRAQELGIPIRPGQISTSPAVKTWDDAMSRLPGAGFNDAVPNRITNTGQREAFSRAVTRTFGEDSPTITPQVMAGARARIGAQMDHIIGRNAVTADDELINAISAIDYGARDALADAAAPVTRALDRVTAHIADRGALNGRLYQSWRQRGGLLNAITESSDPTVSHWGRQLRDALDDAFQRQAVGNDGAVLQQARAQYRNMKIVEPLAEKAAVGEVSPALLLSRVAAEHPDFAYTGGGEIGDLARIGQAFLKAPPNSGTPERSLFLNAITKPVSTALRFGTGVIGGRASNEAINSPAYLARLLGQAPVRSAPLANAPQASGVTAAILARLLSQPANEPR